MDSLLYFLSCGIPFLCRHNQCTEKIMDSIFYYIRNRTLKTVISQWPHQSGHACGSSVCLWGCVGVELPQADLNWARSGVGLRASAHCRAAGSRLAACAGRCGRYCARRPDHSVAVPRTSTLASPTCCSASYLCVEPARAKHHLFGLCLSFRVHCITLGVWKDTSPDLDLP